MKKAEKESAMPKFELPDAVKKELEARLPATLDAWLDDSQTSSLNYDLDLLARRRRDVEMLSGTGSLD